jgi:dipeptidyl aminopeptidase/acylaminoacyl peptidase
MNVAVSSGGPLLYSASNSLNQLTWLDRAGKQVAGVGEPGGFSTFRLSPDGRRVAAAVDGPAARALWLYEVERGVSQRFTGNAENNSFPVWSPDGRTVLYSSGTPRNFFRKDSIRTPYNEHHPRFSPEASPRWVAYQSDETGRYEAYIQSFPEPRGATRISTGGGQYPQRGAGGRELYYVSRDNKLMAVDLKLGADRVDASPPRELFVLPIAEDGFSPYCVDPGGRRFLVKATPRTDPEPLTVIVNWPALLKKETPAP